MDKCRVDTDLLLCKLRSERKDGCPHSDSRRVAADQPSRWTSRKYVGIRDSFEAVSYFLVSGAGLLFWHHTTKVDICGVMNGGICVLYLARTYQ